MNEHSSLVWFAGLVAYMIPIGGGLIIVALVARWAVAWIFYKNVGERLDRIEATQARVEGKLTRVEERPSPVAGG